MRMLLCSFFLGFLVSCAASAKKLNRLSIGMTKSEAIQVMGNPKSTSATQGIEYLLYILDASKTDVSPPEEYFVRITNGKVEGYGRVRDLPGRQVPR
jgi:hypothetical protein